jgi:short-subunit dehydrogenase
MFDYRGKTALVTGASSGIGEVFARELAARGMGLVLVARSEDKLRALAAELTGRYNVRADVVPADLGKDGAARAIHDATQRLGVPIHLLVNNAGFGTAGPFVEQSAEREREELMVNVVSLVELSHCFLPEMVGRRAGAIINVASTAAFQPIPYMAVYAATKAFVLSFSEALWAECRGSNVDVLALCPGPVETRFFEHISLSTWSKAWKDTPEHVVAAGLRALERRRNYVIPAWRDYCKAHLNRLMPRFAVPKMLERVLRRK